MHPAPGLLPSTPETPQVPPRVVPELTQEEAPQMRKVLVQSARGLGEEIEGSQSISVESQALPRFCPDSEGP